MKTSFAIFSVIVILSSGYSQNVYNLYGDLRGDSVTVAHNLPHSYDGEYQPWMDEYHTVGASSVSLSMAFEVLSFPFRTAPSDTFANRILKLPGQTYSNNKWGNINRFFKLYSFEGEAGVDANVLTSKQFGLPASGQRNILPHSIIRHTVYVHCGDSAEVDPIMDSVSFILDHTRGRMKYYPFVNSNYISGEASDHDLSIFPHVLRSAYYGATSNTRGTVDYFPADEANDPDNFSGCSYYPDDPTDTTELGTNWNRPPQFSLAAFQFNGADGQMFAGYIDTNAAKDGIADIYSEGIEHTYIVDKNLDLTVINPVEKVFYNPSKVEITANNLVFPSQYTFKTTRGLFATSEDVYDSPLCDTAGLHWLKGPEIPVPTDLDTSIYHLKSGSKLTIEPCVTIYDAKFIVDSGATLEYTPTQLEGNAVFVDSGGTIDTLAEQSAGCADCLCNEDYNYTDGIEITSDTTWSDDMTIKGMIAIKNNATLTIDSGAIIEFADAKRVHVNTGITVDTGATLIIDSATLRPLWCDDYWNGIIIHGDEDLGQEYFARPNVGHNGRIQVKNEALIEQARYGVIFGHYDPNFDGGTTTFKWPHSKAGGWIEASDAMFRDNLVDVAFTPYDKRNLSKFTDCTFETTRLPSENIFPGAGVDIHMQDVWGVQFLGNTFRNTIHEQFADSLQGVGIQAHNCGLYIGSEGTTTLDSARFENLYRAIENTVWGGIGKRTLTVRNSVFDSVYQAICIAGGNLHQVKRNWFNILTNELDDNEVWDTWAIFTQNAPSDIAGNELFGLKGQDLAERTAYGMVISNTGPWGNRIVENNTDGFDISIQPEEDNRHLSIKCNEYDGTGTFNWYVSPDPDKNTAQMDTLAHQGTDCTQGETANNTFHDTYDPCNNDDFNVNTHEDVQFEYYAPADTLITAPHCHNLDTLFKCGFDDQSCPVIDDSSGWVLIDLFETPNEVADSLNGNTNTQERFRLGGAVLSAYVEDDNLDDMEEFLADLNGQEARRTEVRYFFDQALYDEAQDALDEVTGAAQETIDFKDFYGLLINMADNDSIIYEADNNRKDALDSIASTNTASAIYAQAALHALGEQTFVWKPQKEQEEQGKRGEIEEPLPARVQLWPNPANQTVTVRTGSSPAGEGMLIFRNMAGKTVFLERTNADSNLVLSLENWGAGLYIVGWYSSDGSISQTKLALVR